MLLELCCLVNLMTSDPPKYPITGVDQMKQGTEPTGANASTTARRAGEFINSLSVQIHMNYNAAWGRPQSPYNSNTMVANALTYLNPRGVDTGISTVRDTAFYSNAIAGLNYVGALGYKLDLYMSYDAGHSQSLRAVCRIV